MSIFPFASPEIAVTPVHLSSVSVTVSSETVPGFVTVYVYVTQPPLAPSKIGSAFFTTWIRGGGSGEFATTTVTIDVSTAVSPFA
jgi:hypothetical protein